MSRRATGALPTSCALCHGPGPLCNSHIIPSFLHDRLKNPKRQILGVHGRGKRGARPVQDGVKEPLLCGKCEGYVNDHFEKPFRASWVDGQLLPQAWRRIGETRTLSVDYAAFKLFHLSVLFRADAAASPEYRDVSLGPHRERIRQMLLRLDPGLVQEYRIRGKALVDHRTLGPWDRLISRAIAAKPQGHHCYLIVYAGVEWWFKVSRVPEVKRIEPRSVLAVHNVDYGPRRGRLDNSAARNLSFVN